MERQEARKFEAVEVNEEYSYYWDGAEWTWTKDGVKFKKSVPRK
jgi:hypothetical protein